MNEEVNASVSRNDEDIRLFKTYLYKSKILIVDPNKQAAKRLQTILHELGAVIDNIYLSHSFFDAQMNLEEYKPDVLITEYYLQGEDAFELFKDFKKVRPDQNCCLSIMVTSNSSQSYVAKAAEEEVDAFLIKPYKADFIKQMLFEGTITKINPTEYLRMVDMAKNFIVEGNLNDAKSLLLEAKKMIDDPTLAIYYLGQIDLINEARDSADEKFKSGLDIHEVHFKSLDSLFMNLMEENKIADAYDVMKRMIEFFPFSVERLNQVMKLAVVTENYTDIEDYYKVYKESDFQDNILKKFICASLITMGKYYMIEKETAKAIKAFQRAGSILTTPLFLRNVIETLCDYKLDKDANYFLDLFAGDDRETDHYKICRFLVKALSEQELDEVIEQGKELVYDQLVDSRIVYKFLHFYMRKNGNHEEANTLKERKAEFFTK